MVKLQPRDSLWTSIFFPWISRKCLRVTLTEGATDRVFQVRDFVHFADLDGHLTLSGIAVVSAGTEYL